jgi:hypothetical protein
MPVAVFQAPLRAPIEAAWRPHRAQLHDRREH